VQQLALDGPPTWDLYLPYAQMHPDNIGLAAANMFLVVRTAGDPKRVATLLAREVRRVDPDVAASQIRPLGTYASDAIAPRRFSLSLMTAFGVAALGLAAIGIYSVVSYAAGQRAREIAIRVALGAERRRIVRLIVGEGMRPVAAGLLGGVLLSLAAAPFLSSLLFGVQPGDAATLGLVVALVALLATIACAIPALRLSVTSSFSSSG